VLVTHFKCCRFDVNRLILVLRKTLQGVRHPGILRRRKRTCAQQRGGGHDRTHRDVDDHCLASAPVACAEDCDRPRLRASGVSIMLTPPSKRISAPVSVTSRRFALSVPCSIFTSTGLSETMRPFLMSTIASVKMP